MIDIEECSLRAFEQDLFAAIHRPVQVNHRVRHIRPQFFAGSKIRFVHVAKTDRLRTERLKDSVVLDDLGLQFFREHNRLHQVRHAQARACCLVSVGWADSPFGGANPAAAQLALLVEDPVIRQNKMRAIADEQVFVDIDSQLAQAIHLGHKRDWIDNHAVSDHADFAAAAGFPTESNAARISRRGG